MVENLVVSSIERERHALLDCYGAFCGYFAVRQL